MYIETAKEHKGIFKGDGNVIYLDRESSFTSVFICHNSLNCSLGMDTDYSKVDKKRLKSAPSFITTHFIYWINTW